MMQTSVSNKTPTPRFSFKPEFLCIAATPHQFRQTSRPLVAQLAGLDMGDNLCQVRVSGQEGGGGGGHCGTVRAGCKETQ